MAQQRLIWLPSAVHDLEQIVQYIRRDSKRYAASVARRIVTTAKQIPSFPRAGRVVPEWDVETIRERIVYRYFDLSHHRRRHSHPGDHSRKSNAVGGSSRPGAVAR